MNFCVWSSTVYWELKQLLTRMSNYKKKDKSTVRETQGQTEVVNFIAVDRNTHFLSTFINADKAFQILCKVRVDEEKKLVLNCSQMQADQGFNMNIILTAITRQLKLQFHSLFDVNFAGLTIKMIDH